MVIDFHTHIFPDAMAEKTIAGLEAIGNIKAHTNGTLDGLKDSMRQAGIDISVVLPIVTKPKQFHTINTFAAQITGKDGIISFGGIHPDSEDYKGELEMIKGLGLKGIKLHPDYQKTFIDDERHVNIIDYAAELGLIIVIHAGLDIGLPDPIHCTPQRTACLLQMLKEKNEGNAQNAKIVLAHTGGYDQWDEVEEYLVGQNVWFDISYSLHRIKEEQLLRIIKNHGADKILFATDSPWGGQKETLENFLRLPISEVKRKRILSENAKKLLGVN